MVRVLFADNNAVVRDSIRRILIDDARVEVVGEAADFSEAITKAHQVKPEVLVLNPYMPFEPNLSIRELSAQINSCGAGILAISFENDEDASALATHLGAIELLDKVQFVKELIPAIMRVASAGNRFPPAISAKPTDGAYSNELERPIQSSTGRD